MIDEITPPFGYRLQTEGLDPVAGAEACRRVNLTRQCVRHRAGIGWIDQQAMATTVEQMRRIARAPRRDARCIHRHRLQQHIGRAFPPGGQHESVAARQPRKDIGDRAGQREIVGNFPGMTFAPRFSPDGQRVILSLQQGNNANLFVMDLRSKQTTRLTDTPAIDTAPCYSPDGRSITFESDRGGTQQIYVMPATGGPAQRISFGEGNHSTPVWSPRGDYIAFTGQARGQFSIGILKPDGSGERVLTVGFHNEGPTFAPNGRVLMFFCDPGAGPSLYTIDITGRNELKIPTPSLASDPAWSPLLS